MKTLISMSNSQLYVKHIATEFKRTSSGPSRRGDVTGFSKDSRNRLRRYLLRCEARYRNFCTLTYPADYPHDGVIVKRHLKELLRRMYWLAQGMGYAERWSCIWFLEFQERGAPHFHLFDSLLLLGRKDVETVRVWVKRNWFEIVGSGDNRHLHAGTQYDRFMEGRVGAVAYAMKYAAKLEQKVVPPDFKNVGRFWGVHGLRNLVSAHVMLDDYQLREKRLTEVSKDLWKEILLLEKDGDVVVKRDSSNKVRRVYGRTARGTKSLVRNFWIFSAKSSLAGALISDQECLPGMDLTEELRFYAGY